MLNLSAIRSRERSDAEKFYLKHCIKQWRTKQQQTAANGVAPSTATATGATTTTTTTTTATADILNQLSAQYFRFDELNRVYPDTVTAALTVSEDNTLAGQLIELTFIDDTKNNKTGTGGDSKAAAAAEPLKKQFTGSTSVTALRQLAAKQCKVFVLTKLALYYREPASAAAGSAAGSKSSLALSADWSPVVGTVTADSAATPATPATPSPSPSTAVAADVLLDANKTVSFYEMKSGGTIIARLK